MLPEIDDFGRISESVRAGNTTPTLTTTTLLAKGPIMADSYTTPVRAHLQPREGKADIAAVYLLWMISNKTFMKPSGCWYYSGARSEGGYGVIEVCGKIHRITRIVYDYCVGDLPDELLVLHTCDNPPCCNPSHLFIGNHQANAIDCLSKGRHPFAVLSDDLVREIRRMAKGPSRWSKRQLADRFGVTVSAIEDILTRRSWGHVE